MRNDERVGLLGKRPLCFMTRFPRQRFIKSGEKIHKMGPAGSVAGVVVERVETRTFTDSLCLEHGKPIPAGVFAADAGWDEENLAPRAVSQDALGGLRAPRFEMLEVLRSGGYPPMRMVIIWIAGDVPAGSMPVGLLQSPMRPIFFRVACRIPARPFVDKVKAGQRVRLKPKNRRRYAAISGYDSAPR
jgi:hypothetical protein